MAGVEPSTVKHATILGTRIELPSKDDIISAGPITLFKKLGLQGVSEDEQKNIIQSFYNNPPTAETTLSLKNYPAVQKIVKHLLINLIHKQDPTLSILKDDAMKDDSIIISYTLKNNYAIELSVMIPGHLLKHTTKLQSAHVKANGLTRNGLENSKITTRTTKNEQTAEATQTTPTIQEEPVKVDATNAFIISIVDDDVSITGSMNGEIDEDYLKKVKENKISCKVKITDMLHNLSCNPTQKQVNKYLKGLSPV
jgi:hypothetical protein